MAKIQDTIIFTRPDTDTGFPAQHVHTTDFTDPIRVLNQDLKTEGKRVKKSSTISEDRLTQTVIIEYDSAASKTAYYENSKTTTAVEKRKVYCDGAEIIISESTKEI